MKYIKSILSVMLVAVFMMTSGINASALELSEVESGIYEVQNDVNHESEIGMSMARSYLDPTMKLKINSGKVYYTIKFSGSNYMKDHKISINGKNVNLDIINDDTENHTIELGFEADTIEPDMKASMYVDAMGRDVEFGIITKTDTLNLIEKIEEPEEVVEEEVSSTVEAATETTSNNNTILYVGIGVVVVLVAAFFIMKGKK
ncbi:NEAT domain-containing protein [Romboutsia ilealis]|uniref:NEAT domain-containing protein n=3 Tax=Romboutsia ilealis TaxID=1115758 RepID=UPI0025729896|nr:NEAT domain-containing protein [Romboutsia ilealis]